MSEPPVTPEERERAIRMIYESIGRNGGPPWEELDEDQKLYWYNFSDARAADAKRELTMAADLARYALPIGQMEGKPDGAVLVGGKTYLTQRGQYFGPQERQLQ